MDILLDYRIEGDVGMFKGREGLAMTMHRMPWTVSMEHEDLP